MSSHPQEAFACRGSLGAELRVVPGWQEGAWILNWTNPSRAWPVRRTRKRWRPRPRIGSSDDHPGKQLLPVWAVACLSSQRKPVEPMPKSRTRPELRTAVSGELASRCKPHHNSRSKYAQFKGTINVFVSFCQAGAFAKTDDGQTAGALSGNDTSNTKKLHISREICHSPPK